MEMNLVQIGTNEFFPQLIRLAANKGTYSPARTETRNWGDAIKAQRLLNSSSSFTRRFFPSGTRDGGR